MVHKFTAESGGAAVSMQANRPSWKDMKKNYPAQGTTKYEFYPKISKYLGEQVDSRVYENTCALRMSYALVNSGVKLPKPPVDHTGVRGGLVLGDDGKNYWCRVSELRNELNNRFKSPDEYYRLKPFKKYPDWNFSDLEFRKKEVYDNFISKISNRNGIVVFSVVGWGDSTGHFTLWDSDDKKNISFWVKGEARDKDRKWEGTTGSLLYVGANLEENNPTSNEYYFWHPSSQYNSGTTSAVSFWELK